MAGMDDTKQTRIDNLRAALEARSMGASDLARISGKRVSHFADLLRGVKPFGEKAARSIEELLELDRGSLDAAPTLGGRKEKVTYDGRVPLLTLADLQNFTRSTAGTSPSGGALELLLCPVMHSPRTIATRVTGDSMDAPSGRRYPAGTIVYIDPEVAPTTGRAVLARLAGGELTIKLLREEDGQRWLAPLNPHYPVITAGFEVLGTVIGSFVPE